MVCPNSPGYKKYCSEILQELASKYTFEGVFLDMPFFPAVCYCRHCQKRFFKETGRFIPIIRNFQSKIWKNYIHSRQKWIDEFIEGNTRALKEINPNISVEHNMAAISLNWIQGNTERNFEHSDYAGGDYYGGYLEQTFMCKYYNNMTKTKPFSYITSRCDNSLFFHTVSRTMEDLLVHAVNALVHNGAFSICDAMNPDGTMTESIYKGAIKKVFAITKPLEKYVSGEILSDVAVWYNTNYKVNPNFIQSPMKIATLLREKNIAFDVVGSKNLKNLKAQVLSINDVQEITDEEMADITRFVENGGNLFITGKLAHPRLQEIVGAKIVKGTKFSYAYYTPTEKFRHAMPDFDKSSPYPIEVSPVECEITADDVEIMATLSLPYTTPYEREFSAIHSNPPGIHTNKPVLTKRKVGKGNVIWSCLPMENTLAHNCRQTLANIILSLVKIREFESNAPEFVEILKWKKDDQIYISLVNQQNVCPIYKMNDISIKLNERYANIKCVSDNDEIKVSYEKNKTMITIPTLHIFKIIQCTV